MDAIPDGFPKGCTGLCRCCVKWSGVQCPGAVMSCPLPCRRGQRRRPSRVLRLQQRRGRVRDAARPVPSARPRAPDRRGAVPHSALPRGSDGRPQSGRRAVCKAAAAIEHRSSGAPRCPTASPCLSRGTVDSSANGDSDGDRDSRRGSSIGSSGGGSLDGDGAAEEWRRARGGGKSGGGGGRWPLNAGKH